MKKQTAVEYLFNSIVYKSDITGEYIVRDYINLNYYLDRAKQMERKHIINAYLDGNSSYDHDDIDNIAAEYYKNNFEK